MWWCGTVVENNLTLVNTTTNFSPTPLLPITTVPPSPNTTPVSENSYAIVDSGDSEIYIEVGAPCTNTNTQPLKVHVGTVTG